MCAKHDSRIYLSVVERERESLFYFFILRDVRAVSALRSEVRGERGTGVADSRHTASRGLKVNDGRSFRKVEKYTQHQVGHESRTKGEQ